LEEMSREVGDQKPESLRGDDSEKTSLNRKTYFKSGFSPRSVSPKLISSSNGLFSFESCANKNDD